MESAVGIGVLGVVFVIFYILFLLGYFAVSIYCLVLFIKLALRGIKALDIYLLKQKKEMEIVGGEQYE